jgi:hypothetical protein
MNKLITIFKYSYRFIQGKISMNPSNKRISLILILVMAISISLVAIEPASADIAKPSVPEFSAKLVDYSGAKAVELTIKNQPFESYTDNGQTISLYYNVHFKLHDSDSWTAMYYCGDVFPTHSDSQDITLIYPLQLTVYDNTSYYLLKERGGLYYLLSQVPFNDQMDFRVQAMEGVLTSASFTGQTSDWTNVQTLTIPGPSALSDPTPAESVPELSWFMVLPLFIAVLLVAIVLRVKQRRR